jgi:hypothetical protein
LSRADTPSDLGLGKTSGLSRRQNLIKKFEFGFEPLEFDFDVLPRKRSGSQRSVTKHLASPSIFVLPLQFLSKASFAIFSRTGGALRFAGRCGRRKALPQYILAL